MKTATLILALSFATACSAAPSKAPVKHGGRVNAAAIKPTVSASNITASVSITPTLLQLAADGSITLFVTVDINGATRTRQIAVSPDGAMFMLDGQQIASPPAALQAFGVYLAALVAKVNAACSTVAVTNALTSP